LRAAAFGEESKRFLKGFREFFGESAVGTLGTILTRALVLFSSTFAPGTGGARWAGRSSIHLAAGREPLTPGFGRLSLIGSEQPVFQWRAVETTNDQVHLFRIGGIDERESLGFLRFGIANYFDVVVNKVFCGQPGLDIVFGHPHR